MTEALFGLGGVLLGALVAGAWALYLRRRDERQEARYVARLILSELGIRDSDLKEADLREIPFGRMDFGGRPRLHEVEAQGRVLARYVSEPEWAAFSTSLAVWRGHLDYLYHPNPNEWTHKNEEVIAALRTMTTILRRYS
jgi:hypothetical protein